MPVMQSTYKPPRYLFSGHLQTLAPVFYVKRDNTLYTTEKLELPDGDFVELDWVRNGNEKLMILCHGLEGNSRSHYVQQMAVHFSALGWDILVIHARTCGREMNRLPVIYHGGSTSEIAAVVSTYSEKYQALVLVGFSLGSNMLLNFAARHDIPTNLKAISTFSVPCDLRRSEQKIDQFANRIYARKFLSKLKNKVRKLDTHHPGIYSSIPLELIKSIRSFTTHVTAPYSGFKSIDEYYSASSCLQSLKKISIPTLIVNAQNDPFLSASCFPVDFAKTSDYIYLDMPKQGGHAAFPISKVKSWMPLRVEEFLKDVAGIN